MLARNLVAFVTSAIQRALEQSPAHRSQAGQDLWVCGEVFNEKTRGYFLDIGAHDGIYLSNTYLLEKEYHWDGICIEANPDSFNQLKKNRRAICIQACLDAAEDGVDFAKKGVLGGIVSPDCDNQDGPDNEGEVIRIETQSLEKILIENQAPHEIDYLSIDIEGAEERVLGNFNFQQYRFNCITIERPGESLRAVLNEAGYLLIKEIPGLDCFYIHQSFLKQSSRNLLAFYAKNQKPRH